MSVKKFFKEFKKMSKGKTKEETFEIYSDLEERIKRELSPKEQNVLEEMISNLLNSK